MFEAKSERKSYICCERGIDDNGGDAGKVAEQDWSQSGDDGSRSGPPSRRKEPEETLYEPSAIREKIGEQRERQEDAKHAAKHARDEDQERLVRLYEVPQPDGDARSDFRGGRGLAKDFDSAASQNGLQRTLNDLLQMGDGLKRMGDQPRERKIGHKSDCPYESEERHERHNDPGRSRFAGKPINDWAENKGDSGRNGEGQQHDMDEIDKDRDGEGD